MEQIDRKTAIAAGQSKYFTGKPCRNGHITYRYTSSGTCSGCVAASTYQARDAVMQALPRARLPADVVHQLVELKVRAYPSDVGLVVDTALALAQGRNPDYAVAHVFDNRATDLAGGTYLYRVRVHPDDVAMLKATADALLAAHRVDLGPHLATIHRHIDAQVAAETSQAPRWKP